MSMFKGFTKVVLLFVLATGVSCVGPAPRVYQRDVSTFTPFPVLKLKVPRGEGKKAETYYTVAFVAASYESAMEKAMESQRQAIQQALQSGRGSSMGHYRRIDVAKVDYLDQIKKYLQTDLEQMLLAKNIRVSGPFKTMDEMTFDQKNRAIYSFTPEISINVDTQFKTTTGGGYIEEGNIIVNGVITFILRESLTGEKIWVKRLEAPSIVKPYKFLAKHKETYSVETTLGFAGMPLTSSKNEEQDNTDQVLATALSEFYTALGEKLWIHIDPEEWSKYLDQAENLRKVKRY